MQAEDNGKKNNFFLPIVEAPPTLPERRKGTVVQAEDNGKKKFLVFSF